MFGPRQPQSFSKHLPYAFSLSSEEGWPDGQAVGLLVLKDGHIALGLEVLSAPHLSASNAELNALGATWAQWLRQIPSSMYLQTVVERGTSWATTLEHFAERGGESEPILKTGRRRWADHLAQTSPGQDPLTGGRVVHWLGCEAPVFDQYASSAPEQAGQAISELQRQAVRMMAALESHHVRLRFLSENEVLAECHRAINPTASADLSPPTAPLPPGMLLSDTLPLGYLTAHADHFQLGEPSYYARAIGVLRLPATTLPTFWHQLLWEQAPTTAFRLVVTHKATDPTAQTQRLTQRRKWLHALGGHTFANHGAQRAYEETEEALERMTVDHEAMLSTSITVLTLGETPAALEASSRRIRGVLHGHNIATTTLFYEQLPSWLATLPAYGYRASAKHPMLADAAAHLTPMALPDAGDAEADVLYENRQRSLTAISIRLKGRQDGSAIIVGKTGSGKTFFFSSLLKYGCLSLGGHAIVADIKGPKNSAYRPLCEMLGGSYIHVRGDHSVTFNPFVLREQAFTAKEQFDPERLALTRATLALMASDRDSPADDYVQSVLGDVLRLLYTDPQPPQRPFILTDALAAFKGYSPRNETLKAVASRVQERLEFWCEDPIRRRLFNNPSQSHTEAPLTVFDFEGFERDPPLSAVLMATLASRIESKMINLPYTTPKLFAFDEAWALFDGSPQAATLLDRLYRTARSYGACCYLLTQSHHDISRSAAAQGVLSNLGLLFLMRHQIDHAAVCALFNLHGRQRRMFEGLKMAPNVYAETLLVDLNKRRSQVLRYKPTPFDLWCDSSRPQDVELRRRFHASSGLGWDEVMSRLARRFPQGAPSHEVGIEELIGLGGL